LIYSITAFLPFEAICSLKKRLRASAEYPVAASRMGRKQEDELSSCPIN